MTQYNTLNVKLSNSQLNTLKSGIKDNTKVTLNLSSNLEVVLMMTLILIINYYYLRHKFKRFVKLWKMIHQPIQIFQRLNCLR